MNPFSLVYSALYDMLASRDDFKELIRVGNQIRFDSDTDRDPVKENIQSADLPEVVLVPEGSDTLNIHSTSSSTMLTRQYQWIVSTGDFRVNSYLHEVEWAVFTGMTDWQSKLTKLQWCNRYFVKRANFTGVTNGFSDSDANRGIMGWSAIWGCEVEMHFVTKELKDGCP